MAGPPKFSNIFGAQHPPQPTTIWERRRNTQLPTTQRAAAARHGTLRNLAERLNLIIHPWYPPYFGGFLPNSLIFLAPANPLSRHPNGHGGGMRNYRPKKATPRNATELHGKIRNPTGRLNLAIPHWAPPYFGGFIPNPINFSAPNAPFPNWERRRNTKLPTEQRGAAGHHGTLRRLTARLNIATRSGIRHILADCPQIL